MSSLTFWSEHRQDHLKIERIAHESYDLSQQWSIDAKESSFFGWVTVWIEAGALQNFVTQLRECERSRRGEARLEAMSPREFSLRIFNARAKGDFALEFQIGYESGEFPNYLRGGFAFDPSFLPQILREFEELQTIEARYSTYSGEAET